MSPRHRSRLPRRPRSAPAPRSPASRFKWTSRSSRNRRWAMTQVTVAALQLALNEPDEADNIAAVAALVEQAAARGARIVLPPELFAGPYFCALEDEARF